MTFKFIKLHHFWNNVIPFAYLAYRYAFLYPTLTFFNISTLCLISHDKNKTEQLFKMFHFFRNEYACLQSMRCDVVGGK